MVVPIRVAEVMHRGVETIPPEATVTEIAARLRTAEVGSLVVVDEKNRGDGSGNDGNDGNGENDGNEPIGIVTEADLVDVLADGSSPESTTAKACLSSPLVTIGADESIRRAASLLREHGIKKLPVTDGERSSEGGVLDDGDENGDEDEDDGDGDDGESNGDLVGIVTTTDLSYYLPRLALGEGRTKATDRGPAASPEMAYDQVDWEFDYDGDRETVDVGDAVRFRKTLSDDDVRAFADASGDTNRVHLDEEFAAGTRFGGRICHGTLVGGTVSAALARLPGLTIYLAQELSYQAPIEIGETVTAVCEVVETVGDGRYRLSTTVFDADDERVIEGEAVVLIDDLPSGVGEIERPAESA